MAGATGRQAPSVTGIEDPTERKRSLSEYLVQFLKLGEHKLGEV